MDTLMFGITALSVVIAATASAVAWRVTRADLRRRAARVSALATAAGLEAGRIRGNASAVEVPSGLHEFMPARAAEPAAVNTPRAGTPDIAAPVPTMFGPPVADSGSGGRQHGLLAAAVSMAILVGGGSLVLLMTGRTPAVSPAVGHAPLELVALGHARTDGQLLVSGVVHNPESGQAVGPLEAEVRVFDGAGILIATRSGPVDPASLSPGQEAPFAVALGEALTAARYRVSFASRGTMLAHVDRRSNLPAGVTADAR